VGKINGLWDFCKKTFPAEGLNEKMNDEVGRCPNE
jgi:hypothetical protein